MKKKLLTQTIVLLAVLTAFSCSKDDDPTYAEPAHRNLLLEIENPDSKQVFIYDSNFNLFSQESFVDGYSSGTSQYTFENGKIKRVTSVGRRIEFSYIGDQIDNVKTYNGAAPNEQLTGTESYVYGINRVTEYYYAASGDGYRRVYRYDPVTGNTIDLNIYETTSIDNVGVFLTKTTYGNYDSNKNPLADLPFWNFPLVQKNNPGKVEDETGYVRNYTYEYNADGYPTKRTSGGGSIETYKYQRL
jgi:hypothetical protein